jgi:hypothetical protein
MQCGLEEHVQLHFHAPLPEADDSMPMLMLSLTVLLLRLPWAATLAASLTWVNSAGNVLHVRGCSCAVNVLQVRGYIIAGNFLHVHGYNSAGNVLHVNGCSCAGNVLQVRGCISAAALEEGSFVVMSAVHQALCFGSIFIMIMQYDCASHTCNTATRSPRQ